MIRHITYISNKRALAALDSRHPSSGLGEATSQPDDWQRPPVFFSTQEIARPTCQTALNAQPVSQLSQSSNRTSGAENERLVFPNFPRECNCIHFSVRGTQSEPTFCPFPVSKPPVD